MANLTDELRRVYDEAFDALTPRSHPLIRERENAGLLAVARHVARMQRDSDYGMRDAHPCDLWPLITDRD